MQLSAGNFLQEVTTYRKQTQACFNPETPHRRGGVVLRQHLEYSVKL
jgi:hypothetical protein